ncbi:QueT transporter family protein [Eremococcus coleocola]|uniref:QueT transporter n=1 Tax=Eremococcus coleocola ACS-139-V-Col8 TaxID=908337 RepID=E4KMS4_9LACT|nr:QueT transporter family protein [Eremococcus coleocola]EFR31628.1 hypothetical protein HMPREF9257_0137 [Eremococcus coleocola ACS-139-V-Col8]
MNHQGQSVNSKAHDMTLMAVVSALYVVLTFLLAPLAFGPGFRISEGLNFLALYNKRHIYAITVGVFIVNYFAYGIWDMVIGSLSSLVFLFIGKYLAEKAATWAQKAGFKGDPMLVKYAILAIVFSLSMFTITLMIIMLGSGDAFWPLYISQVVIELGSLALGAIFMYPLSKRIDFTR